MGGIMTKFTYKQLLIIKHAVYFYMKRDSASGEDYDSERALLKKVKNQIELMKEKMS